MLVHSRVAYFHSGTDRCGEVKLDIEDLFKESTTSMLAVAPSHQLCMAVSEFMLVTNFEYY